jgi:ATF/CREB family transcription factor
MLAGPAGTNDYFGDAPFSRGFPTPNESSLRTGLTPGGGGSMFPAPSPNTQAIFNSLQPSGGATPGTLDFLRTVNRASAAAQSSNFGPTSQPTDSTVPASMDKNFQQPQTQAPSDPFGHPDANDAANGLYMLAQANGNRAQFPPAGPPAALQTNVAQMGGAGTQPEETSPLTKTANRSSIGTISGDNVGFSDSGESEQLSKPATRSRGKKAAASNRRKADDTPAKQPASKRAKNNNSKMNDLMMSDDDDMDLKMDDTKDTRKMTDEEKRKNFLERNRIAALKCRQRKKQWLANLQAKVELFSTENDALSQTVTQLREEIVNLRSLLLAHRDCPVSASQGIAGGNMAAFLEGNHHNPYGMAAQANGMPQSMAMQMPHAGPAGQMQRS